MKKFTFTFLSLIIGLFVFAQTSSPVLDEGPKGPIANSSKAIWTVQFQYGSMPGNGSAGCETDGTNLFVTQWSGDIIWRYTMAGVLVDSFAISGVSGLRDLAYDGQYFYGGASANTIYKMDFNSTPPSLISTITSPTETVRNICYDAEADGGAGAFWVGNWSTDFSLVSRSGTVLNTIPATSHGLLSTYGTAYDAYSSGGPYIWAISAGDPENTTIFQIKVSTGMPTGITHDITTDIASAGDLGGGLWIHSGIVAGTTTLGGLVQNTKIYGYEIGPATSINDASANNIISNIYPNPASDVLFIDMDLTSSEDVQVSIVNSLGQNVKVKDLGTLSGKQKVSMDVSSLSSGIYYVNITVNNKKYSKSIIIK